CSSIPRDACNPNRAAWPNRAAIPRSTRRRSRARASCASLPPGATACPSPRHSSSRSSSATRRRAGPCRRGSRTPRVPDLRRFPRRSVKDRIGVAMIEAAEREGRLKPGGLIVEATSGNTGVGLALAAAVKGYRCVFTMPDKMSQEKARLLRALGAEVIITPTAVPPDHPENYIMKGRAIAAAHPNAIFADQHYNPVNPDVHYRTTGPELWEQTAGKITHFVCAPGTGGTVSGAGRFLKEKNPRVR